MENLEVFKKFWMGGLLSEHFKDVPEAIHRLRQIVLSLETADII
jgi:hypothetical protein